MMVTPGPTAPLDPQRGGAGSSRRSTFAFDVDSDGALHLVAHPAIDPGDAFVWATNPWIKIAGPGHIPTTSRIPLEIADAAAGARWPGGRRTPTDPERRIGCHPKGG
jgi:hypothetical protein